MLARPFSAGLPAKRAVASWICVWGIACSPEGAGRPESTPAASDETPPANLSTQWAPDAAVVGGSAAAHFRGDYSFTQDWFTHNVPVWQQLFAELAGQPGLSYLEIGVWEGMAMVWMFENVLTDPTSRATAIDLFPDDLLDRFNRNLEASGRREHVQAIAAPSREGLRGLAPESFDVIYVDGSHTADDVLSDAVMSWLLLKPGGMLIFDDYKHNPRFPLELRPQVAIDAFITSFRNYLDAVHRGYQVAVRKRPNPCPEKWGCSDFGRYWYDWFQGELIDRSDGSVVSLSDPEKAVLEQLGRSRPFGASGYSIPEGLASNEVYVELAKRLDLQLE